MNLSIDVINSPYDIRDYGICAANDFPSEHKCPISTSIKNQGSKPTCVAHAVSSLIEYHYKRQTSNSEIFSTEFIYGYREPTYYQGNGMIIKNALNTILKYGDPFLYECKGNSDVEDAKKAVDANIDTLKDCAYPHRISTYYRCNSDAEIKTALMTHGPVVASMNTYDGGNLVNDVYVWNPNAKYGRHCILIIGWNETGWLIQNSWGTYYGGDGCFTLPFNFKLNEAWGVTDTIDDNDLMINKPEKWKVVLSSIINYIVNLIRQITKQN